MVIHVFVGSIVHLSPRIIENFIKEFKDLNQIFIVSFIENANPFFSKTQIEIEWINKYKRLFDKLNYKNAYIVKNTKELFSIISKNKDSKIIFHGLPSSSLKTVMNIELYLLFSRRFKHTSLVCWGFNDFALETASSIKSNIINFYLKRMRVRYKEVLFLSRRDLYEYNKLYNAANSLFVSYFGEKDRTFINRNKNINHTINIQLSHSGWQHNNHFKSFELLEKFKNENIMITCPLCYGDEQYIKNVILRGKEIFGDKFNYFTELLPIDIYNQMVNDADVFVTSADVQTGLFAVSSALSGGAKIFVGNNIYDSFKADGIRINHVDLLKDMDFKTFSKPISKEDFENNKEKYLQSYGRISNIEKWLNIMK